MFSEFILVIAVFSLAVLLYYIDFIHDKYDSYVSVINMKTTINKLQAYKEILEQWKVILLIH